MLEEYPAFVHCVVFLPPLVNYKIFRLVVLMETVLYSFVPCSIVERSGHNDD